MHQYINNINQSCKKSHQYINDDDRPDGETHGYVGYNDEYIDKICVDNLDDQYFISSWESSICVPSCAFIYLFIYFIVY